MIGNAVLAVASRIGTRRMEKRPAGAAGAIHDIFGEALEIVRIVIFFVANNVDQPAPTAAKTDNFIAFTERAEGYSTNRRVQSWDIASSRQNSNYTFFHVDISHGQVSHFPCGVANKRLSTRSQFLGSQKTG